MRNPSVLHMIYTGSSMEPTFMRGDRVYYRPCAGEEIRRGDVIIFTPGGSGRKIMHRVISAGPAGIRTSGDGNPRPDPWVLTPGEITGRVTHLQREGKRRRVSGGLAGRLRCNVLRLKSSIRSSAADCLDPLLRPLPKAGALMRRLPEKYRPRILSFRRPEENQMLIVMGRLVIGWYVPGVCGWRIRRRFRLFIDEASLPSPSIPSSLFRDRLSC
ncbi:MAG: signal peptidase I [Syntrophales bacterium]